MREVLAGRAEIDLAGRRDAANGADGHQQAKDLERLAADPLRLEDEHEHHHRTDDHHLRQRSHRTRDDRKAEPGCEHRRVAPVLDREADHATEGIPLADRRRLVRLHGAGSAAASASCNPSPLAVRCLRTSLAS